VGGKMMSKHVMDDAKRCLQCKNPQCSKGCPVGTPIRDAIQMLLESDVKQAGQLLFENNPLSIICCRVCPQENQCEGHCVTGIKSTPVQISAIEQYISDFYLNVYEPKKSDKTAGKIGIIGSGPAGITIALLLAKKNYDVTIFEGNDSIGGVLRYGIPEFRLPKKYIDNLGSVLIKSGVKIRPNTTIGTTLNIDDMFRDGFQAIFLGTGVWNPRKMNIKGESLGNVNYAIEYLRKPNAYDLGEKVVVIGAGNVAIDAARTAVRQGVREVSIVSYKSEEMMAARETEIRYAKIDGVKFHYLKSAVEFTEKGVVFADSKVVSDGNNINVVGTVEGTEELMECDSIIVAIGQVPRAVIVSSSPGIEVNSKGLVVVNEFGETSRPGVYASGDVVTGAKTVVEAVRFSKIVANAMDNYVQNLKKN